ncbi:hypothetical protein [Streptantibioticus cattleyicolor]|uniref:Uncharacterized protein n=1 Tax=Streptantibioticus cattleyicolor (strain ATCC 35852 / DSM 46488 / JCM 4925 / NBRC 14057 / NRRL 8057) TaxID=1003195 RepID=F8JJW9_STREN|nr:hypothetical protein [Streptantibioticus cattleyicolor]AEW98602.1 hypothetical protein SCATT_p04090 [Streptantibioticus cattleyicolor NRRL 8057 = DSM 46488]CCB72339.1 protein of unknown function [Streptantibioticus cattleyicolor NRRL 8057 = DSM 46488]
MNGSDEETAEPGPATHDGLSNEDPAYWARPQFRIVAPDFPQISMVSCPQCPCAAYSDGSGHWRCMKCGPVFVEYGSGLERPDDRT